MKTQLRKKIASYSGLATATILSIHEADAQIIYTDPPDITLSGVGAHESFDLNNDGVYDIKISIFDSYPGSPGFGDAVSGNPTENVQVFDYSNCQGDFFYGYGVVPFKAGQKIPTENNGHLNWQAAYYGPILDWDYYGETCHRWSNSHHKFMGVRIQTSPSHFNYGWVRLSVNTYGNKIKIHDWAYNTIPDSAISAGQTMRIAIENFPATNDIQVYSYGKQIFINQNGPASALEITVYNSIGELVTEVKTSDLSVKLESEEWAAGIYIVQVRSRDGITSKKILIN